MRRVSGSLDLRPVSKELLVRGVFPLAFERCQEFPKLVQFGTIFRDLPVRDLVQRDHRGRIGHHSLAKPGAIRRARQRKHLLENGGTCLGGVPCQPFIAGPLTNTLGALT